MLLWVALYSTVQKVLEYTWAPCQWAIMLTVYWLEMYSTRSDLSMQWSFFFFDILPAWLLHSPQGHLILLSFLHTSSAVLGSGSDSAVQHCVQRMSFRRLLAPHRAAPHARLSAFPWRPPTILLKAHSVSGHDRCSALVMRWPATALLSLSWVFGHVLAKRTKTAKEEEEKEKEKRRAHSVYSHRGFTAV